MKRWIAVLPFVLPPLLFVAATAAESEDGRDWGWHMGWAWGPGPMVFGGLTMLIFWGVIVWLLVIAVRWLAAPRRRPAEKPRSGAIDILRERYARGEIDTAEFEERKRVLGE